MDKEKGKKIQRYFYYFRWVIFLLFAGLIMYYKK